MTARSNMQRRRDQRADFLRPDDLDKRLNKIVDRSANTIAENARKIVAGERSPPKRRPDSVITPQT